MNIEKAKTLLIGPVLIKQGAVFSHTRGVHANWYYSYRGERTPSVKVNERDGKAIDFGTSNGEGDIIDTVIDAEDFHREQAGLPGRGRKHPEAIKDALKYLEFFDNMPDMARPVFTPTDDEPSDHYVVEELSDRITDKFVKREFIRRCLTLDAGEYLKQAKVKNTKKNKKFNVIGLENIRGGVELHMHYPDAINPKFRNFKNISGHKDISVFPAHFAEKKVTGYAFSSKWDFATELHRHGRQKNITYVIYHGDGLINKCAEFFVSDKDRIYSVLHFNHNDTSGKKADDDLALILVEEGFIYGNKGQDYKDYKDLSEWHMANPHGVYNVTPVYQPDHPQARNNFKHSL